MEWARNHLGELVAASEFGTLSWALACPNCGEPVRRRAGSERRPHFAHFSHRAKPDCENYFPGHGVNGPVSNVGLVARSSIAHLRAIQSGLYLVRNVERKTFELCLRIPAVLGDEGAGGIDVRSGQGTRSYTVSQLSRSRLVPLQPNSHPASCVGMGQLVSLAIHLNGVIAEFGNGLNIFSSGEEGGRLLPRHEVLEWGRAYLVLTSTHLEIPHEAVNVLQLTGLGHLSNWHVYEAVLTNDTTLMKSDACSAANRFLGRDIRKAQPRAYLVHPMPHHIDLDGTFVFDRWPKSIVVRTTADAPVTLVAGYGARASYLTRRTQSDFVYLERLEVGSNEAVLAIGGRDQLMMRTEEVAIFLPTGVTVSSNEESWDLLNCRVLEEGISDDSLTSMEFPSARLASHMARRNLDWMLNETMFVASRNHQEFLGENFGDIRIAQSPTVSDEQSNVDVTAQVNALPQQSSRWLDWLVTSQFGGNASATLNSSLARSAISLQPLLMRSKAGALLPYIARQRTNKNR